MGFSLNRIVSSRGFRNFMSKLYGFGASVVILGALFKILHLQGADYMLIVGMSTEAIIFFFSAFEPPHVEVDWSIVYPELSFMYSSSPKPKKKAAVDKPTQEGAVESLNKMFQESGIDNTLIKNLGEGMRKLGENANQMTTITSGVAANEEFASNLKKAASKVSTFTTSLEKTSDVVEHEFSSSLKQSNENVAKVAASTAELTAKLQTSMNEFMSNLEAGSKQTVMFQEQTKELTSNLAALNSVYGNMLSAMSVKK